MANVRNLRIGFNIRQSSRRMNGKREQTTVPQLKIEGKWFEAAGFEVGENVQVEIFKGVLVLKPLKVMEVVR